MNFSDFYRLNDGSMGRLGTMERERLGYSLNSSSLKGESLALSNSTVITNTIPTLINLENAFAETMNKVI